MNDIDYYELLGVSRSVDGGALKASYRKLAMQYHPDRNPGCQDSEKRFKAISEAYDCLKSPEKRAIYDRYGKAGLRNGGGGAAGAGAGAGFGDIGDIFESFFGSAFGGGGNRSDQRGAARGADLRYDLEVGLEEVYSGCRRDITIDVAVRCSNCGGKGAKPGTGTCRCSACGGQGKIRAQQGFFMIERTCSKCEGIGEIIENPCPTCHGEGRLDRRQNLSINIPLGVDNGARIRVSGRGEAGANGVQAGDLYIFVHVKQHKLFERDGTNLYARAPISFTTAILGGSITIPGLDGARHELSIPAGIQSGKQVSKRGAGMPVFNSHGYGDMVVQVEVETPTRLTSEQRELIEAFRVTETGKECPQSESFFDRIKDMWSDLTDRPTGSG